MAEIKRVWAREVLDSRGYPTVEAEVSLADGAVGHFIVPSGASTGEGEALELRDHDSHRFLGKGVLAAVRNVREVIGPVITGKPGDDQKTIDHVLSELDGTPNKSKLGANAILSVSMACAKAAASSQQKQLFQYLAGPQISLPVPFMNVLNGGAHADNNLSIQEMMIVPAGAPSFKEALRYGAEVFHALKAGLKKQGLSTSVGDEGGFAPQLKSNRHGFDTLLQAIEDAKLRTGKDVWLAIDAAASQFFDTKRKVYSMEAGKELDLAQLIDEWAKLCTEYPILSIEDPLHEADWEGFAALTHRLSDKMQIVGDDLFVTNPQLIRKGIAEKSANAVLIKPNQIGTLSETLSAIQIAKDAKWGVMVSHRSGETEDTTIADLAVATNAGQIKTGSLCRGERTAKYNRLLRIEEMLGDRAQYAGWRNK